MFTGSVSSSTGSTTSYTPSSTSCETAGSIASIFTPAPETAGSIASTGWIA